jgi:hypothetical protein
VRRKSAATEHEQQTVNNNRIAAIFGETETRVGNKFLSPATVDRRTEGVQR